MKKMKKVLLLVTLFFCISTQQVSALTVFSSYNGPQEGATVRDVDLVQQSAFITNIDSSGIAVTSESIYLSSANQIFRYSHDGTLVTSLTFPDTAIVYNDVAVGHNNLYSAYSGSAQGVTVRDPNTLDESSFFATGVNATGIAAGLSNDVYLAADNQLIRYQNDGTLLNTFTWGDTTLDYLDVAVGDGNLYATYAGPLQGVTVRDLTSLAQSSFFATTFDSTGIAAGLGDTLYLTDGNSLYHYRNDGTLLNTFTFPSSGINYTSLATVVIPEPADFNKDGSVDSQDLSIWETAFGVSDGADADNDGDSDGNDFLTWQRQFTGDLSQLAASAPVPEPSTGVLLAGLAVFGMLGQRSSHLLRSRARTKPPSH